MIDSRSLVIRIASCLFLAVLAVSCTHNLILNHEIEAMQITTNPLNAKGVTVQINDPGTIQEVVDKMNHSMREPVKFRAYYSVKLKYRGGKEVEILINGRDLKLDGKTRRTANEDIGDMLSRLIKRYTAQVL